MVFCLEKRVYFCVFYGVGKRSTRGGDKVGAVEREKEKRIG